MSEIMIYLENLTGIEVFILVVKLLLLAISTSTIVICISRLYKNELVSPLTILKPAMRIILLIALAFVWLEFIESIIRYYNQIPAVEQTNK